AFRRPQRRDRRRLVRERRRRADRRDGAWRGVPRLHGGALRRGNREPGLRLHAPQRRRRDDLRRHDRPRTRPDRLVRSRRDGRGAARVPELDGAQHIHGDAVDRAARAGSGRARPARRHGAADRSRRLLYRRRDKPSAQLRGDPGMSAAAATTSRRRYGPSAFGDDLRRFWNLTVTLATTEFKLRYFGSVLGYVWSLARPLLFFGVLYVFFTKALKLGNGVPHYPVYLLSSIILWTFFVETTSGCVQCL